MPAKNSESFSAALPLIVMFIMMQQSHFGVGQLVIAAVAALATNSFIPVVADLVWMPLLRKLGFWWTSLLLGFAIVAACFAPTLAGVRPGDFLGKVLLSASTTGALFSWVLAAMRGAEDTKARSQLSDPTLIRSRLIRGRRRALQ